MDLTVRERLIESILKLPEDEIPVVSKYILSRHTERLHREVDALSDSSVPDARLVVELTIEFDTELLKELRELSPGKSDREMLEELITTERGRRRPSSHDA